MLECNYSIITICLYYQEVAGLPGNPNQRTETPGERDINDGSIQHLNEIIENNRKKFECLKTKR